MKAIFFALLLITTPAPAALADCRFGKTSAELREMIENGDFVKMNVVDPSKHAVDSTEVTMIREVVTDEGETLTRKQAIQKFVASEGTLEYFKIPEVRSQARYALVTWAPGDNEFGQVFKIIPGTAEEGATIRSIAAVVDGDLENCRY